MALRKKATTALRLTVVNHSGRAVPIAFLRRWCRLMGELAGKEAAIPKARFKGKEVVIAFLAADAARATNLQFRGKDYATDVLSFESDEVGVLGELVICPEVISRQAKEHGLLVREELGYMVLHGFLHLLGFDHERSAAEAKRMFAIQDRLFDRLLSATR